MYASAVGLLLYGAEMQGRDNKIRIRDTNVFHSILARMKKWFVDIS